MSLAMHVAKALEWNLNLIKTLLSDLSDADLLVRPVPGANHAAWQLGHLITSQRGLIELAKPGSIPELPAGFNEMFSKKTTALDNPAAFPAKTDMLAVFEKQNQAAIAWAMSLKESDLEPEMPEKIRFLAPTVGAMVFVLVSHAAMHIGQIQVLRRKLGKPVLM